MTDIQATLQVEGPARRPSLPRNIAAGTVQAFVSAVVSFAAIPVYLRYLGIDAYGLVGLFTTLQSVLQIFDLGLSPTVTREVARCSAQGDLRPAALLVRSLSAWYWGFAGAIVVAGVAGSSFAASHWLQSSHLSTASIRQALLLMAMVLAARWPISFYQATLLGAERIVTVSIVGTTLAVLAALGGVCVVKYVCPSAQAFFAWQALIGLVQVVALRTLSWRALGRHSRGRLPPAEMLRVLKFSAAMGGVAVSGLFLTQFDKLLLSRLVPLDVFGRYMLATSVSATLYMIVSPVFTSVYPRFASLVVRGEERALEETYETATTLLGAFLFPAALILVFFGRDLVTIWTGDPNLGATIAPMVAYLALGTALHGVTHFPFALQLAYGAARLTLAVSFGLSLVLVPLIFFLTRSFGAFGAAASWLVLHSINMVLSSWLTHRRFLRHMGGRWLLWDVCVPYARSAVIVAGFAAIARSIHAGGLASVACAAAAGITSLGTTLATTPRFRDMVRSRFFSCS